jgi:hypothetical protein
MGTQAPALVWRRVVPAELTALPESLLPVAQHAGVLMISSSSQGGHSAQVKMQLLVNGSSIAIAQMGPDFLLIDGPIDHPPGAASLVLQVDKSERRWNVPLPDGISATSKRVQIAVVS